MRKDSSTPSTASYNLAFGGFESESDATQLVNYPIDTPVSGGSIDSRPMLAWIYSVVSKEESKRVIRAVKEADPAAFVNALRTEELSGRFYQKPTE